MDYKTPLGCFKTWEEAAAACERADLDPCSCIWIEETIDLGADDLFDAPAEIIAAMKERLGLEKSR